MVEIIRQFDSGCMGKLLREECEFATRAHASCLVGRANIIASGRVHPSEREASSRGIILVEAAIVRDTVSKADTPMSRSLPNGFSHDRSFHRRGRGRDSCSHFKEKSLKSAASGISIQYYIPESFSTPGFLGRKPDVDTQATY